MTHHRNIGTKGEAFGTQNLCNGTRKKGMNFLSNFPEKENSFSGSQQEKGSRVLGFSCSFFLVDPFWSCLKSNLVGGGCCCDHVGLDLQCVLSEIRALLGFWRDLIYVTCFYECYAFVVLLRNGRKVKEMRGKTVLGLGEKLSKKLGRILFSWAWIMVWNCMIFYIFFEFLSN